MREVTSACTCFFFFQAEDGIRDYKVTGVQTCALPICGGENVQAAERGDAGVADDDVDAAVRGYGFGVGALDVLLARYVEPQRDRATQIGRGAWRGRGEISGGAGSLKKKKKKKRKRGSEKEKKSCITNERIV